MQLRLEAQGWRVTWPNYQARLFLERTLRRDMESAGDIGSSHLTPAETTLVISACIKAGRAVSVDGEWTYPGEGV